MILTTDVMPGIAGIAERYPLLALIVDHMSLTAEM
jgi:hypothetical protein